MKVRKKHTNKSLHKRPFSFRREIGARGFFILLLLVSSFATSQEMVKAEIDTTNIRIGEQFIYKISVDGTENVIIPKLELKNLEIVDSLKTDTIKNRIIKKYVLTGFDSGAFYIPQQQIFLRNQAFLTDSLLINVATVPIDTTKVKKYEIKGIRGEPYQFDDFKNYFYWIIGTLILIGLLLYFLVFKKKKKEESKEIIPAISPFEQAMKNLQELDGKLLWQNNKIKQYYSELTEIIRQYIELELNIPALENTTDEIIETLTNLKEVKSIKTDKETIKKLKELLQKADLVKFAKSKPLANEIELDRKETENIINNLKPVIVKDDAE